MAKNYGGGLYNDHAITNVENSLITENSAYMGGGIFNYGIVIVEQKSVISKNKATGGSDDDGVYGGGGVFNWGTLNINKATITENIAPYGGGVFNGYKMGKLNVDDMQSINGNTEDNIYNDTFHPHGIFTFPGRNHDYNQDINHNPGNDPSGYVVNNYLSTSMALLNSKNYNHQKNLKTIPMQHTGAPLLPGIAGLIIILSGLIVNKRK